MKASASLSASTHSSARKMDQRRTSNCSTGLRHTSRTAPLNMKTKQRPRFTRLCFHRSISNSLATPSPSSGLRGDATAHGICSYLIRCTRPHLLSFSFWADRISVHRTRKQWNPSDAIRRICSATRALKPWCLRATRHASLPGMYETLENKPTSDTYNQLTAYILRPDLFAKTFTKMVLSSQVLSKFRHTPFIYAFFDLDHENYEVYPADAFDRLFPWFYYAGLFSVREGRFARVGGDASFRRLGVPALCVGFDWDKWKRSKDIAPLVLPFATTRRNIGSMSPSTDIDGASDDWQTLSPSSPLAHNLFSTMTGTCSCDNCLLDLMRQNVQRMRELRDDIQASFLSSPASSSSPNSLSYIQPLSPFDPIPVSPALCSYPECQPLGPGTPDYPAYYGPPSLGYATVQGYPDPPCSQYWQHENAAPVGPPSVSAWSSPYPCPPGFLSVFYSPHRIDFMENDIICPSTPTPISLPSLTTDMSSPIGPPTPRTPRLSVDSGTTLVTPYSPMDWSSNNNNSEEKWDRFAPETYVPGGLAAFAGNAQWASMDSIVPRG